MTSREAAAVYAHAERRWFTTALRRRVVGYGVAGGIDHVAIWKARYCARAASLCAFWRRLAKVAP